MTGWRFLFPTLPHLTLCITTFTFYPINWEFNGVLVYVCNTWGSQGRVPGLRRRLWPLATAVPRPPHLYTKSSLRLFRIHPHPQHRCWEGLHFHLAWATPACWAVDENIRARIKSMLSRDSSSWMHTRTPTVAYAHGRTQRGTPMGLSSPMPMGVPSKYRIVGRPATHTHTS
jgi:hypothetical protein